MRAVSDELEMDNSIVVGGGYLGLELAHAWVDAHANVGTHVPLKTSHALIIVFPQKVLVNEPLMS